MSEYNIISSKIGMNGKEEEYMVAYEGTLVDYIKETQKLNDGKAIIVVYMCYAITYDQYQSF